MFARHYYASLQGLDYQLINLSYSRMHNQKKFFIIGAPKCGTTSLSSWLSSHPNIFMCSPKEPYFFCTDIHSIRAASTLEEYKKLFMGVKVSHLAIGEASTTYLRSFIAVPSILKIYPEAIFIVCLRNPIEMVASVHMQLFQSTVEPESSLRKAWTLQALRNEGMCLPKLCREPSNFQYGKVCSLGEQVDRLLKVVPRQRVLFLFLEDLRDAAREQYCRVLHFLDVPDDGRIYFPVKNKRSAPKSLFIRQVITRAHQYKYSLGIKKSFGLGTLSRKLNQRQLNDISWCETDFFNELKEYFSSDCEKLSSLVGKDLSEWLQK